MKRNTPFDYEIVKSKIAESGLDSLGKANIREIVKIANQVEKSTGKKYIRLEMGVPGLPVPQIATDAEIEALKKGVGAQYPNIEGIRTLKEETSRFLKLFLNIDVSSQGCVPHQPPYQSRFFVGGRIALYRVDVGPTGVLV